MLALLSVVLWGCSVWQEEDGYSRPSGRAFPPPAAGDEKVSSVEVGAAMPWERWSYGRDLTGAKIRNSDLLSGDEFLKRGQRQKALEQYQKIKLNQLDPAVREAATYRLAATYLSLDRPSNASRVMSDYFRSRKIAADAVGNDFALLFGYAYGAAGNAEQSVVWFKSAYLTSGSQEMRRLAEQAVLQLLRTLPAEQMDQIDRAFSRDPFVNPLIGQERSRRSNGGIVSTGRRFWEIPRADKEPPAPASVVPSTGSRYLMGVLLPLSGKFTALGASVKGGVQIALEAASAQAEAGLFSASFRDSGSGVERAVSSTVELISTEGASVVIGPLLSEEAGPAAEAARQNGTPILVFSKNSAFQTGGGVFRLGPTVESQVDSLVEEVSSRLGLKNFAIVSPEDVNGREFAAAFRHKVQAMGLNVAFETSYSKEDPGALLAVSQELESRSEIQAVFLPDNLQAASRLGTALSPGQRGRLRLLGSASWDNPQELSNSRAALEGAVFVSPFFADTQRPMVAQFIQAYQRRFKRDPDFLAAQGFDAATITLAALKRSREEGLSFVQAFSEIDGYEGLTGHLSVESSGEVRRRFEVVELTAGGIAELASRAGDGIIRADGSGFTSSTLEDRARRFYEEDGTRQ